MKTTSHTCTSLIAALGAALVLGATPGVIPAAPQAAAPAGADVSIHLWSPSASGDGNAMIRIRCAAGSLATPANRRCNALLRFAKVNADGRPGRQCQSERFGPERARVTGRIGAASINSRISRIDSCGERKWQALMAVTGSQSVPQ